MGYLNKATITVDAILTNRGRELLAAGGVDGFKISQFAVSDDEIDYGLYNVGAAEGTLHYGEIIENMPILEATPDEQQVLRYKLASFQDFYDNLNNSTLIPPVVTDYDDEVVTVNTPATKRFATNNFNGAEETYTLLIANARLVTIENAGVKVTSTQFNSNGSVSIQIESGTDVTFTKITGRVGSTTATVFGNLTGATATFTITAS